MDVKTTSCCPAPKELSLTDKIWNLMAAYTAFCLGYLLLCSWCSRRHTDHQCSWSTSWCCREEGLRDSLGADATQWRTSILPVAGGVMEPAPWSFVHLTGNLGAPACKQRRILVFPITCNCRNSALGTSWFFGCAWCCRHNDPFFCLLSEATFQKQCPKCPSETHW